MVVLVTGGSGFIGSHVVDRLLGAGYDVRVFDKVRPLQEKVEWYRGDLLEAKDSLEACADIEAVFHLAAIADVNVALSHPELCLQVNEIGTLNLLKSATAKEAERIVLASTTWVYGRSTGIVTEETSIPFPDHIYTKTKIGQEHLVKVWREHFSLPYTILRYDIPYGYRMRSNMVASVFARRAIRGEPITVFGDGEQGRCFIYVDDLAEGNMAALKKQGENQVFNLAGKEFVTINQIVQILNEIFRDMKVSYEAARPGDFKGVVVSNEKARSFLGWEPRTSFREGLLKYINYLKQER